MLLSVLLFMPNMLLLSVSGDVRRFWEAEFSLLRGGDAARCLKEFSLLGARCLKEPNFPAPGAPLLTDLLAITSGEVALRPTFFN